MPHPKDKLILALDVPTLDEAVALRVRLDAYFGWFKVGLELFSANGPSVFDSLPANRTFLDVKYHDIPNTVFGASRAAARMGVWMFNVHASGGAEMMRAAKRGAEEGAEGRTPPLVIAVTVLSSVDSAVWNDELDIPTPVADQVVRNAVLAKTAGLDGVVASAHEVARIRAECGLDFVIMTPGIRPAGAPMGDQKRVMTPLEAIRAGSTYLGIGRAVTAAPDPEAAARAILDEIGIQDQGFPFGA
ncbi:MAG TPA: orotidine-5'-phosphate decarboxylase [Armatimonadota bacterium]|jgi:orotidine-5'-phosphate decarboxylase|nr:orotidine-5'-phosphate decarboxylase [Armatimonadota bacterium]